MTFNSRNVDWWCERGILAFVLATLVFAPVAFGAVYTWTQLVVEALAMGVALIWLVRIWGGHKPKILWPPLAWIILAFVLYAFARYLTADIEYVARLELLQILLYAFLFFAVVSNLYNQDSSETVAYTLTIVAALTASYAIFQFTHHSNHVWNFTAPYPGRGTGTYINPDHFAGFLELVLPLPLAFLMAGRIGVIARLLLAYASLTILGGLAVTFSRGGWIAAAAGILMLLGMLLCHRNHRLRATLVLLLLLLAGVAGAAMLSKSVIYMRRVASPDQSGPAVLETTARLQMWTCAVEMWRDYPLLGVGPGHFDYRFREYRPEAFQQRPEHAHNDYLELLADWGVVGAGIVFAGIAVFIAGLIRTWPHVKRDENDFGSGMSNRYAFFLGGISGLFALAVHSLVDFNLHIPANALIGVTILALVVANIRFATKRYWVRARLPLQCTITLLILGGLIVFGYQSWRRAGEMVWTKRAEALIPFSTAQADALKSALAFEPKNFLTAYNIGECYRTQSFDGGDNYAELAKKALDFYLMGIRLNPDDAYCSLRAGMCLDWLGKSADSEKYYSAAEFRDPSGNFVVGNIAWHYLQTGDYPAARQWFTRACILGNWHNDTANNYLWWVCNPKLNERASGKLPMQFYYPRKDN